MADGVERIKSLRRNRDWRIRLEKGQLNPFTRIKLGKTASDGNIWFVWQEFEEDMLQLLICSVNQEVTLCAKEEGKGWEQGKSRSLERMWNIRKCSHRACQERDDGNQVGLPGSTENPVD